VATDWAELAARAKGNDALEEAAALVARVRIRAPESEGSGEVGAVFSAPPCRAELVIGPWQCFEAKTQSGGGEELRSVGAAIEQMNHHADHNFGVRRGWHGRGDGAGVLQLLRCAGCRLSRRRQCRVFILSSKVLHPLRR
jgi:hypothetical protein